MLFFEGVGGEGGLPEPKTKGMNKSYLQMTMKGSIMTKIERRTISLPTEHSVFIDEKVASGAFASASEVVRAGLRALQERDAAVERWLKEDVAPAFDALQADPNRAIPMEDVMAGIRARHAAKLRGVA